MRRLTRLESYMSDKQSPTSPGNNNVGSKDCDSSVKCDTTCDYISSSSFDIESEDTVRHSNRPPFKRQNFSEETERNSLISQNSISDPPPKYINSIGPLNRHPLTEVHQPACENHIEMTPLLLER